MANDIVFIAEAVRVERLRHRLAMCPDASREERLEYLRRRANLLTVVAERTGDGADRLLAEKAWTTVRAMTEDGTTVGAAELGDTGKAEKPGNTVTGAAEFKDTGKIEDTGNRADPAGPG